MERDPISKREEALGCPYCVPELPGAIAWTPCCYTRALISELYISEDLKMGLSSKDWRF